MAYLIALYFWIVRVFLRCTDQIEPSWIPPYASFMLWIVISFDRMTSILWSCFKILSLSRFVSEQNCTTSSTVNGLPYRSPSWGSGAIRRMASKSGSNAGSGVKFRWTFFGGGIYLIRCGSPCSRSWIGDCWGETGRNENDERSCDRPFEQVPKGATVQRSAYLRVVNVLILCLGNSFVPLNT